jgi:hypothetical protein
MPVFSDWKTSELVRGTGYGGTPSKTTWGQSNEQASSYKLRGLRASLAAQATEFAGYNGWGYDGGGTNGAFGGVMRDPNDPYQIVQYWYYSDGPSASFTTPPGAEYGDTMVMVLQGPADMMTAYPGQVLPGWTVQHEVITGWYGLWILTKTCPGPNSVQSVFTGGSPAYTEPATVPTPEFGASIWYYQGAATLSNFADNAGTDGATYHTAPASTGAHNVQIVASSEGYWNHGLRVDGMPIRAYYGGGGESVFRHMYINYDGAHAGTRVDHVWDFTNENWRGISFTISAAVKEMSKVQFVESVHFVNLAPWVDEKKLNGIKADTSDPDVSDPDFIGYCFPDAPRTPLIEDDQYGSSNAPYGPDEHWLYNEDLLEPGNPTGPVYIEAQFVITTTWGTPQEKAEQFGIALVTEPTVEIGNPYDNVPPYETGLRARLLTALKGGDFSNSASSKVTYLGSLGSFNAPNGTLVTPATSGGVSMTLDDPTNNVRSFWWRRLPRRGAFYAPSSPYATPSSVGIPISYFKNMRAALVIFPMRLTGNNFVYLGSGSDVDFPLKNGEGTKIQMVDITGVLAYQPLMKYRLAFKDPLLNLGPVTAEVHFTPT